MTRHAFSRVGFGVAPWQLRRTIEHFEVQVPKHVSRILFCQKGGLAMATRTALAILLLLLSATPSEAAEPKPETLRAWDEYVLSVNANMADRAAGTKPF